MTSHGGSLLPLHLRLCATCRHTQGRHDPVAPHPCRADTTREPCTCRAFELPERNPS